MQGSRCVIMFVKYPERGTVKSRLAAAVGEDAALALYRCFVADLMKTLGERGYPLKVFFDPPGLRRRLVNWLGENIELVPQSTGDLGQRMRSAFELVFAQGAGAAVLIGSDSPDLPGAIIDEALASLHRHDAVLGPSCDGGYYMIGFRADAFHPRAFAGIPWSTPAVFAHTVAALSAIPCRTHILPRWRDIDTFADLEAFYRENSCSPRVETATMKLIRKKGWDRLWTKPPLHNSGQEESDERI